LDPHKAHKGVKDGVNTLVTKQNSELRALTPPGQLLGLVRLIVESGKNSKWHENDTIEGCSSVKWQSRV